MHDLMRVREREGVGDLERELDRAPGGQRTGALDELLQVPAVDVLEDDELLPVVLSAVDHGDDVGVRELCDRARLVPEAPHVILVLGVVGMEHLQRHLPLE
jgi:hypothetical protein